MYLAMWFAITLVPSNDNLDMNWVGVSQQTRFKLIIHAGFMLGHRRRRWPNIKPALDQCVGFGGI